MKLSETELLQRVISVMSKTNGVPEEQITVDTSLDELGLDSVDAVNIVFALEEEFGIEIPGDGILEVKNVGQMVTQLSAALAQSD